jgi:LPXTG-site transpeptidase (sortase) family protein
MHARIASACRLFFSSALIVFLLLNLWSIATPVQAERSNSLSGAGSARPLFAPVPDVTLNAPASPFIGDSLSFTVTFDNTGSNTGYGPYIDLFLPLSGADGLSGGGPNDGISFVSASYLGQSVTTNVLNCPAGSNITHPLTGQTITCPSQPSGLYSPFTWQLVVITLPFGSFVPSQPPATVTVNANLSNYADLGVALPIQAQGGFMFGADPLNNPATDPPITGSPVSTNVTPTLLTLSKSYNGPEDETATGPNFPRQYTVTAQIASGQSMTAFNLTDVLPNNMQFVSLISTTPGGASCTLPSTSAPGGTLSCNFSGSVSGTVTMTFEYYIPLRDSTNASVIDPITGDDAISCNNASAGGTWATPLDPRDSGGTFTQNPAGCEHTLTDKSIAIQKSVSVVGGGIPKPGAVLEYTLNFQVSDFFAFQNISITDIISDGQHFDSSFTPTMQINGNTYFLPAAGMNANNVDVVCNYTGGPGPECDSDDPAANDGTTTITFDVSPEIIARGQDGRLIGGCVPTSGTGGGDPNCNSYNDGPTTGTIVFRTVIQENFTDTYPSGDPSVDQGDTLNDTVTINGDLLSTSNASTPTGQSEADTSAASVSIPRGTISKSIYALNGNTSIPSSVRIAPGDTVTYRITYTLPTSDFEDLVITDYLPLPIYSATEVTTFSNTVCGVPGPGSSCYGPADSFRFLNSTIPTLTTNSAANSITWTYGDYDSSANAPSTIDLLFTVTVNNQPFADGLYLTNQANAQEGSTNASSSAADAIIQVQLQEPVVGISKGVVWTNNPAGVFSPSPVGPVTFTGSGCPAFSGTITSSGLASHPVSSNLSGVDAGDQVMMAIILENTGRYSAFDVRVKDSLPAGMTLVPGSVCVTDGTGAPISTTDLGGGLFGSGLELDDPGPTNPPAGALDPGKNPDGSPVNTGRNIAVITYLVTLDTSVKVGQTLTNTATLFNYAGTEGGPDHTVNDPTDTASVTITKPLLSKALTSTNQTFTTDPNVAVGEMVTYTITITVPEGTTPNAVFSDTLDPGLAFVSCDSITASSSVSATAGFNCANAMISANSGGVGEPGEANGRVLTYNFGTITNSDTNNSTAETITIQYTAVVLNSASINRGWVRSNYAGLWWDGGSQGANVTSVTVVEPTLQVNKTAAPTTGDAGDTITYTAVLSHTGVSNADAFEAHLRDDLSTLPVTLNTASITVTPGAGCGSPTVTNNSTATMVDVTVTPFPLGCSVTVTYQVTLNNTVFPGQVITNTAQLDWTSLPGNVISPQTPNNNLSCERTGNAAGCGGTNNDYTASDPATVTVNVTPVKSIVATSEDSTGPQGGVQRLVIGEIVRYRLQVQWPEGTALNAMLRDNLPAGLQFLNDNTAKVAFVCNGGPTCMSSSNPLIGSLPVVNGNETNVASITPSFVLPDDAVSSSATTNDDTYGSGTAPYFKFSDLVNSDNDSDQEFVVVEFNALVLNINTNQAGTTRGNTFSVMVGNVVRATSGTVNIVVAEPSLSLSKVVTTAPTDAGDPMTYTLTITNNSSGVNRATAFDLTLTDNFDANLTGLSVSSVTTTQGGTCVGPSGLGTTAFSHNGGVFVGNTLTFTATCLDPGQSITITVTGTVAATAPAGYTIPNSATVTYTSLPGPNGASPNPTGSVTPGTSGSGTGERNGQDGVGGALNDYAATASASAPLSAPQIDKRTPTPASAPIGGTVTFPILVTLPEGVTQSLVVTDNLPVGLVYVSHSVVTTAAASGGLLAADYNGTLPAPTVTAPGGSGDDLTLNFGNVTTAADNDATNNAFVIFVTARVNNELGNQNGTVLGNTASLTYTNPNTGTTTIADPTAENVTVLEPELNIVKSADDTTPAYGQTLTYTLTVSHLASSTSTAYDIVITDTIPAGLTYVAGSISAPAGWTTNDTAAPTLTWTCSAPCSLPVGNTASLSYQVTVNGPPGPPNPGDVLTNTASMTWTSLDGTDPNERTGAGGINDYADSDPENVTLTYPDLTITKTDGQTTYVPGSPVVYTIVVSNVGNGDATGATVSDSIPSQITSWSWACTAQTGGASGCDPYSGNGNFSDVVNLPAGASITYTVTAQTDPAATTDLVNTAIVTPPSGITDPTPGNNTASDTDTPDPQADLAVTKDDGVLTYIPGGTLTYTITVTNNGPSDAPGALVTDNIPAQFSSWTWTCTAQNGGASGCDGYGPGNANFSDTVNLPAGASITYTVSASVASSATGNLVNTVTVAAPTGVTDPNSGNNTASDTDMQNSQAAISVTKDDGVTQYVPGSTLTYTITVTNAGPSDALGVSVTDNIPPQFTSWTWTCLSSSGGASGCTAYSGSGNFTDSIDLAGPFPSSITYQVVAQVASSATGNLTNTVTISHPAYSTPGDNTASDTDTQNSQADLYVTKTDGQPTYTPGVGLTYTVVVGNNGPSDVSGAVVSDTRPAQVTSWTWTCAGTSGGASGCDGDNTNPAAFTDTVDLPAGSSITYSVTVTIPSSATGDLTNTVSVTPPAGVTDTDNTNNTATDTDTQNSQAAISVTKDDGVTQYVPGGTLTYTITVTNTGPSDALGVSVTDNIPAQFTSWTWTCLSSSGGASGCTTYSGSGDFTDSIDLAGPFSSSITYQVVAQVASSATGNLTNTVTISHPADSTPDDNTASDTDTPNPQADLAVTKDDGVTVIAPDSTITYTITVTNNGPSDANGATVSDPKPSQIDTWTWVCTASSGGATGCDGYGPGNADFSDTVNLPAGSSITYTVTAHIDASATSGTLTNTVTVTPPGGVTDPTPGNNSDDDVDQIVAQPTGDLTKSLIATNQGFTPDPSVAIGEMLTYEVTFTVPAGGTMTNLKLTDTLDRGLAFVDCVSVTASDPAITTTLAGGFADACNDPTNPTVATEPSGSTNPADAGRKITFTLGDVSNSGASNGTVSVRYTVVVLDSIENQDGVSLKNSATLTWDSGSLSTAAPEVTIVEPDFELTKEADRTVATPGSVITFTLTLRHTNASNVDAFDVVLTDVLPPGLTYVPGSLTIVSGPPGGVPDDTGAPTLRVRWANFPLLTGSSRTQAVVRFQAVLGNLAPGQRVRNTASLEWTSLPGDVSAPQSLYNTLSTERYYDPGSNVNVYGVLASLDITVPRLPATGFAPGVVTSIPAQPAEKAYTDLGDFWLEIPKLGVKMPIVGIPARGEEWDLTWLWDQAGWLEGTAYPTHAGNSAITAHVYLPNGQPGPFYKLDALRFGDAVIVHLGGQRYVFEVRQVQRVSPNTLSALRHEELPWLTLITCREYDPKTNSYRSRLIVRAVLVKILE